MDEHDRGPFGHAHFGPLKKKADGTPRTARQVLDETFAKGPHAGRVRNLLWADFLRMRDEMLLLYRVIADWEQAHADEKAQRVQAETAMAALQTPQAVQGDANDVAPVISLVMATFYLAPATSASPGNDSNAGTSPGAPWLTKGHAVTTMPGGSTLLIRGGFHDLNFLNDIPSGTSWVPGSYTRIAAYPGEDVWLQPSSGGAGQCAISLSSPGHFRFIEFDGINIDMQECPHDVNVGTLHFESSSTGTGTHDIRYKNFTSIGAYGADTFPGGPVHFGIFCEDTGRATSGNITISNGVFYQGGESGGFCYAVYAAVPNVTIEYCDISDTNSYGIQIYNGSVSTNLEGITVRYCRIHDITRHHAGYGHAGIVALNTTGLQLYGNQVWNIGSDVPATDGNSRSAGILVAGGVNTYVWFNTVFGCTGVDGAAVPNTYGIWITSGNGSATVQNNISFGNSATDFYNAGASTTHDHNCDDGTDPLFVDAGADDFRITALSPAYLAGVDVGIVSDIDGRLYGSPPSMGASEFDGLAESSAWVRIDGAHAGGDSVIATTEGVDEIDTTDANLIVVDSGFFAGGASDVVVHDEYGNTWTPLTQRINGSFIGNQLFVCLNPVTGPGHWFSAQSVTALTYPSICVEAWRRDGGCALGGEYGATSAAAASMATGSVTPSEDDALILSGLTFDNNGGGAVSINLSFSTHTEPYAGGVNEGSSLAYKILATATPTNPTWDVTNTSSAGLAAAIAWFKAADDTPPFSQTVWNVPPRRAALARLPQSFRPGVTETPTRPFVPVEWPTPPKPRQLSVTQRTVTNWAALTPAAENPFTPVSWPLPLRRPDVPISERSFAHRSVASEFYGVEFNVVWAAGSNAVVQ